MRESNISTEQWSAWVSAWGPHRKWTNTSKKTLKHTKKTRIKHKKTTTCNHQRYTLHHHIFDCRNPKACWRCGGRECGVVLNTSTRRIDWPITSGLWTLKNQSGLVFVAVSGLRGSSLGLAHSSLCYLTISGSWRMINTFTKGVSILPTQTTLPRNIPHDWTPTPGYTSHNYNYKTLTLIKHPQELLQQSPKKKKTKQIKTKYQHPPKTSKKKKTHTH